MFPISMICHLVKGYKEFVQHTINSQVNFSSHVQHERDKVIGVVVHIIIVYVTVSGKRTHFAHFFKTSYCYCSEE